MINARRGVFSDPDKRLGAYLGPAIWLACTRLCETRGLHLGPASCLIAFLRETKRRNGEKEMVERRWGRKKGRSV